jgi:hypothetical protein
MPKWTRPVGILLLASCAVNLVVGILIGFRIGLGKFTTNDVVEALRPIYRTKMGEKMGDWIGPKPMKPITLKAKPGYVVGGFSAYRGLSIESLCLDFVKLEKGRLQLNDTYKSAWVGDRWGFRQPESVAVQGYFFVGITGRYSHENTPCSLGLTAVLRKEAGERPRSSG